MQKRRTHKKSRHGCQACKKQHIKCDESGPPCTNCSLRATECVYTRLPPGRPSAAEEARQSASKSPDTDATSVTEPCSLDLATAATKCIDEAIDSGTQPRRLLEIELMHRWMASTWQGFTNIPEDESYSTHSIPRLALTHPPLLDGLFSAAALEIAFGMRGRVPAKSEAYLRAAWRYYDSASSGFRAYLSDPSYHSGDSHQVLVYLSTVIVVLNLVIAQLPLDRRGTDDGDGDDHAESDALLRRIHLAFELLNSTASIASWEWAALMESSYPLQAFMSYGKADASYLDAETKAAMERLRALNRDLHAPPGEEPPPGENEGLAQDPFRCFRHSVECLELSFAEEARGKIKGYCISLPSMAGRRFSLALARREPFALLIVMYWGYQLDVQCRDYWWCVSVGRDLSVEIYDVLCDMGIAHQEPWAECIQWVKARLDPPDISIMSLDDT